MTSDDRIRTRVRTPIEPLSEASWNRIENAVLQELDDRARVAVPRPRAALPRWALVALAGVVLLQAAVAVVLLLRGESGQHERMASARFVSTREPSDALLGDVALHLEPDSALVVVSDALGSLCVLERGAVRFAVPSRGARPAFVVQAGDARVEVVGTRFRVERVAATAVVETYEGKVRVVAHGQTRFVTRGQRWSGVPQGAAVPTTTLRATTPRATTTTNSTPVPQAPAVIAPSSPALPAPQAAPRADQRARFEQAAAREAKDPRQALHIYRVLAHESGAWAQNALYAQGRLELELGRASDAQRALRSYLERYPAGANVADARALLQRLNQREDNRKP